MQAMRRWLLVVAAGTAAAAPASVACVCVALDARSKLKAADAAFVGQVLAIRQAPDDPRDPWDVDPRFATFRVDRAVKGNVGGRLRLRIPGEGNSCSPNLRTGRRYGVFLHRRGGWWSTVGLCSVVPPAELLALARR